MTSRSEYLNKVKWNVNRRIWHILAFISRWNLFFYEITFNRRPLREESGRQLQPSSLQTAINAELLEISSTAVDQLLMLYVFA